MCRRATVIITCMPGLPVPPRRLAGHETGKLSRNGAIISDMHTRADTFRGLGGVASPRLEVDFASTVLRILPPDCWTRN